MTVLFVVGTIIFFLAVDFVVRKMKGEAILPAMQPVPHGQYPIRIPDGIFFAKSHTWVNLFPSGQIRLGVDDFVGRLLERPEITLLKKPGDSIRKGDPLMLLKSASHVMTIRSPLEGDVVAVNEELPAHSEFLRNSLFDNGWGYVIKPGRLSEIKELLLGKEARAWVSSEFRRLRELLANIGNADAGELAFMQDGGLPAAGVLSSLDDETWKKFEQEFLQIQ